jgi:regulator of protease activity HflC (stomatin/prohibitin superfamily)
MSQSSPNDTRYSFAAIAAGIAIGGALGALLFGLGVAAAVAVAAGLAFALFFAASIKYTDQWEKAVVLRLGRYRGLRGPGFFPVMPILDRVPYHIDGRIRTAAFGAESCLTRDTVPVDVDAIAFWVVHDPERAALEV